MRKFLFDKEINKITIISMNFEPHIAQISLKDYDIITFWKSEDGLCATGRDVINQSHLAAA